MFMGLTPKPKAFYCSAPSTFTPTNEIKHYFLDETCWLLTAQAPPSKHVNELHQTSIHHLWGIDSVSFTRLFMWAKRHVPNGDPSGPCLSELFNVC